MSTTMATSTVALANCTAFWMMVPTPCSTSALRVTVGCGPLPDGCSMLRVEDNGPGIPAHLRGQVFERFVRLDEGRARDDGGSGLGLAIVREVARAHGGDAWITASPTGGARFVLELPVATDRS